MRIKLQVHKIRCVRNSTFEFNDDEIYFSVFAIGGKKEGNKVVPVGDKYLFGFVSSVQENVKKDTIWQPEDGQIEIDLGDASAFIIKFCLYEKDNGAIYNEMKEKFENGPIKPIEVPIPNISFPTGVPTDWLGIAIELSKLLPVVISSIKSDDLMGVVDLQYYAGDKDLNVAYPQEYGIRKVFGKYEVSLSVSKIID